MGEDTSSSLDSGKLVGKEETVRHIQIRLFFQQTSGRDWNKRE